MIVSTGINMPRPYMILRKVIEVLSAWDSRMRIRWYDFTIRIHLVWYHLDDKMYRSTSRCYSRNVFVELSSG